MDDQIMIRQEVLKFWKHELQERLERYTVLDRRTLAIGVAVKCIQECIDRELEVKPDAVL